MRKTKEKILEKSRELFNLHGVSEVSIRMISRELGISHSNLSYHYKDKNSLVSALHQQILEQAIALNQSLSTSNNTFKDLLESIHEGFKILYQYRFFMVDLNLIMRENKPLHVQFREIEKLRFTMYQTKIDDLLAEGILRKEKYSGEYTHLITQIRIISDYWLASAQIYETDKGVDNAKKYSDLVVALFFPYLSLKGEQLYFEAQEKED